MVHFEDLRKTAYDAENDLNSYQAKQGLGKKSDSSKLPAPLRIMFSVLILKFTAQESGVDEMTEKRFADHGASVKYGPGATASGSDHRKVPEDEGGTRDDRGR